MRVSVLALAAACGGGDNGKVDVIAEHLPAALLSVWAGAPDNVWVVGGHAGTGGPIVEHYDGTGWTKLDTSSLAGIDLWWVKGFDDGKVYVSGSQGTIASIDGTTFTKLTTPPGNVTVFGMWGATSTDVWAVGGTGQTGGFAWRYDGAAWTVFPGFPSDLATGGTCWKVNGAAANNIWLSGTNGSVMHWNGSMLERMDIADAQEQQESLFSIDVNSKRAITVGGGSSAVLYENDGSGWKSPLKNIGIQRLSGVAVSDSSAYAVGQGGAILRRESGGSWVTDASGTIESLHAAYLDPSGDLWVVGGNFNATPTSDGVLLHKGVALQGSFQ